MAASLPPLLHAAQAAQLFRDSKTLVDMPLAAPQQQVAAAFEALQLPDAAAHPEERHRALQRFVDTWLRPAGSDLLPAALPTLAAGPPHGWLAGLTDPEARRWAEHLFRMWGALCRQAAPEVAAHPDRHSLLAPAGGAPFVVPGARFREQYYWDTFWSLRGLLVCGLTELAQGIVSTLLSLVEQHGFVPNGLRSYYLNRSQPPLLSQMVAAVHAAAPDRQLLRRALAALQREHAYWTTGPKQVVLQGADGRLHRLSRYCAAWDQPRPESYREDVATAAGLGEAAARALWRELASAAESGWDFSSRWMADPGRGLASCRTTRVVPADLNALLYQAERNMSAFASELGDAELAAQFAQRAQQRLDSISALMWDEAGGQWWDLILAEPEEAGSGGGGGGGGGTAAPAAQALDPAAAAAAAAPGAAAPAAAGAGEAGSAQHASMYSSSFRQSGVVAASNWVPLYCGCAPAGSRQAAAAVAALQDSGLVQAGGVAASLEETGEQWDAPNSWPPITCMLLEGCEQYGCAAGRQLAAQLAAQYLRTAHAAWLQSGRMWEKFDARHPGAPGRGGEYEVVDGFGWTNGVALLLLERYGWPGATEEAVPAREAAGAGGGA